MLVELVHEKKTGDDDTRKRPRDADEIKAGDDDTHKRPHVTVVGGHVETVHTEAWYNWQFEQLPSVMRSRCLTAATTRIVLSDNK
jgi:hypothetical protein